MRAVAVGVAALTLMGLIACTDSGTGPIPLDPVVVQSPLHLPGTLVQGAAARWYADNRPPRAGDPVPVQVSAYCLTRPAAQRSRSVRAGIVAADARLFPIGRHVELYADGRLLGRFLVDNTSRLTKGSVMEIWMPTCRESRQFGRRSGIAVLAPSVAAPASARAPR